MREQGESAKQGAWEVSDEEKGSARGTRKDRREKQELSGSVRGQEWRRAPGERDDEVIKKCARTDAVKRRMEGDEHNQMSEHKDVSNRTHGTWWRQGLVDLGGTMDPTLAGQQEGRPTSVRVQPIRAARENARGQETQWGVLERTERERERETGKRWGEENESTFTLHLRPKTPSGKPQQQQQQKRSAFSEVFGCDVHGPSLSISRGQVSFT